MDLHEVSRAGEAVMEQRLALFPVTTEVVAADRELMIGGLAVEALAERYGTPLYLYDAATIDAAVAAYRRGLAVYPGSSGLSYAGKAYLSLALAQWTQRHSLLLDCTGIGEIALALAAGVPRERILVHGVNKSGQILEAALARAGVIVVDNAVEMERLAQMVSSGRYPPPWPDLWLRLRPGSIVTTHRHMQTGQHDSKFGMGAGELKRVAALARRTGLPIRGLHFHLGSQFRDWEPVAAALERALAVAVALEMGPEWVLCPGGGLAVAYHEEDLPHPDPAAYAAALSKVVVAGSQTRGLPLPHLQLEPGRSLVARAGVAVYRTGVVKRGPRRRWLLLDGGLADNLRHALYGARYSALPVRDPLRPATSPATFAGPYCESGDILIDELPFADIAAGDLVAVPVSGAYQLSMANNYNGALRPAVLWLEDGRPTLIQAREEEAALLARERSLDAGALSTP